MMRTYIRKTFRQNWSESDLENAVKDVLEGKKIFSSAQMYKIPYETLRRQVAKRKSDNEPHSISKPGN